MRKPADKRSAKRPVKSGERRRQAPARPGPAEDLVAVSRALLGPGDDRRMRKPVDDASVEDPLLDWPKDD